jgi:hypothetical protein
MLLFHATPLREWKNSRKEEGPMFTVSDALELGAAQELILSEIKRESKFDDDELNTFRPQEYFDE